MCSEIFGPVAGEQLACSRETNNAADRYAVAVVTQEPTLNL